MRKKEDPLVRQAQNIIGKKYEKIEGRVIITCVLLLTWAVGVISGIFFTALLTY